MYTDTRRVYLYTTIHIINNIFAHVGIMKYKTIRVQYFRGLNTETQFSAQLYNTDTPVAQKIIFEYKTTLLWSPRFIPIMVLKYAAESTTSLRELNRDWNSFALFFRIYAQTHTNTKIYTYIHIHIHIHTYTRTCIHTYYILIHTHTYKRCACALHGAHGRFIELLSGIRFKSSKTWPKNFMIIMTRYRANTNWCCVHLF